MKKFIFGAMFLLLAISPIAAEDVIFRDPLINNKFTQSSFDSSQPFTASAWVKPQQLYNEDYKNPIVSQHGEASGWEIRLLPNSVIFMYTVNGNHRYLKANVPVDLNQWIHIKAGYDKGKMTLFVNNDLVATKEVRHNPTPYNGPITIARNGYWTDRVFRGQVRDLEIIWSAPEKAELRTTPIKGKPEKYTSFPEKPSKKKVADFSKPQITGEFTVSTRGVDSNPYYKGSHRMLRPNSSVIEAKINLQRPRQFSTLRLNHLTSMSGGKEGYSPITINVNGVDIVKNYNPKKGNYFSEDFNVKDYLRRGENSIKISLGSAQTHYWIRRLELL